jgi:hypothetical protein
LRDSANAARESSKTAAKTDLRFTLASTHGAMRSIPTHTQVVHAFLSNLWTSGLMTQTPNTRKTPMLKHQSDRPAGLDVGAWCSSGACCLVFGV